MARNTNRVRNGEFGHVAFAKGAHGYRKGIPAGMAALDEDTGMADLPHSTVVKMVTHTQEGQTDTLTSKPEGGVGVCQPAAIAAIDSKPPSWSGGVELAQAKSAPHNSGHGFVC